MHDLRYAFRMIAQNWAFSFTVILILALCIGATAAVLAVVNAAMLRPLAYPEPERLASVVAVFHHAGASENDNSHDGRTWEAVRDRVPAVDAAVFTDWITGVNMGVNGSGVYVLQQRVSAGFFRVLGGAPAIGREFIESEDRAGGAPAVILSHVLWTRYFNHDPNVIGRGILLRGEPYTVVGIMPAGFRSNTKADLWTPIRPSRTGEGGGNNYGIIARLKPGVIWQQAVSQLAVLAPDLKREGSYSKDADVRLDLIPLQHDMTSDLRQPLMLLWAAVTSVFVLGCVNISGLLLARASGRVAEIATRLALGAQFSRIVRQLLVESLALGLLGGAAGIAVGWGGLAALRALGSTTFSFLETVEPDWRVLAAAILLALLAGLAFGIVPAFQAARTDLRSAYTSGRGIAGRKRFVSMGALVGGQVALTIPLLTGAGLLLHTFLYLWSLNPGFDPSHVLTARFSLQDARYATSQKMNQLFDNTLDRLRQTPGMEVAAASLSLPYERGLNVGVRLPGEDRSSITNMNYVTPDFFAALRIPLLRGRLLTAVDGPRSVHTAVVNQAFVKRYFKKGDALGEPLGVSGTQTQIVGVVGDIQARRAGWGGDFGPLAPVPTVYVPATQFEDLGVHIWFSPSWIVRSSLPGPEITAAIENATHSADPLLPTAEFRSINDIKAESLSLQRLMAALAGALAGLAMVLSSMGIYGLTANLVAERTKEMGIRMALGSSVAGAIQLALKPGLTWVFAGIIAGSLAAVGIERFLKSFLWGVHPNDPWTMAVVSLTLFVATGLASLLPALRIVRMNPADTLRTE